MAIKTKSRITSKAPKMVKQPYRGSYLEGQATMGKVFNPSLRKFYGWDNIKPKWTSKV
jgi:hypothetical protein